MGWQWHELDHMRIICTSLQRNNHASTSSVNFLQAGCSSWQPTSSVKALKANGTARILKSIVGCLLHLQSRAKNQADYFQGKSALFSPLLRWNYQSETPIQQDCVNKPTRSGPCSGALQTNTQHPTSVHLLVSSTPCNAAGTTASREERMWSGSAASRAVRVERSAETSTED